MDPVALLELKNISKSFAAVKALNDVSFTVSKAEVHALMGENGAGKSTIIKIFTGVYQKDEGEMHFNGEELSIANALEAQIFGISTIYQELNLSPFLSVAENVFLGREIKNKIGLIDWAEINTQAKARLLEIGIDIDVKKPLHLYSTAIQQMVSIARALVIDAKMLVMDEPTSSLDKDEVEILFNVIRQVKSKGVSVIFVSHRLDEVFEICDRATVLKDGEFMGTYKIEDLDVVKMVSLMIGKDASSLLKRTKEHNQDKRKAPIFCSLNNVCKGNILNNITFDIHQGEVLGLAGLLGSGRTEIAKIIFGDDPYYTGNVEINGEKIRFSSSRDAINHGIAFCSEDRKVEGIFPKMDISDNMAIPSLPQLSKMGVINANKQNNICDDYIKRLNIKTPSKKTPMRNLSGGNQQKVILARWLAMNPKMIILDEPTRGIDVGAKSEIEKLIQEVASSGISVLFVSSELEELVRGCDRVIVLYNGTNVKEFTGSNITYENIVGAIAEGGTRSIHQRQSGDKVEAGGNII